MPLFFVKVRKKIFIVNLTLLRHLVFLLYKLFLKIEINPFDLFHSESFFEKNGELIASLKEQQYRSPISVSHLT